MAGYGMVLGIMSLLCSTILLVVSPYLIFGAPPCTAVGLPLSWLAFKRARKYETASSDVPLAGLIVNWVALGFIIAWTILFVQQGVFSEITSTPVW